MHRLAICACTCVCVSTRLLVVPEVTVAGLKIANLGEVDLRAHLKSKADSAIDGSLASKQSRCSDFACSGPVAQHGWKERSSRGGGGGLARHSTIKEMDPPHCLDV